MGKRALFLCAFAFACSWFSSFVFANPLHKDGSVRTSKRCSCDSVQFWLPKRTNGASNVLSYEEISSNTHSNINLLSKKKNTYRALRLWVPKHCELLLDKTEILLETIRFHRQNIADRSIEIWFADTSEGCVAGTLKCKLTATCVGIDTRQKEAVKLTQRKLLMYKTDSNEEAFSHQHYGVVLSVLVFCSMAILIALCGKSEKNSQESVARDSISDNVVIVSSEKLQSLPRESHVIERENEKITEVEGSKDSATDGNSNNHSQVAADVDLSLVAVTDGNLYEDVDSTVVDGAVFGKNLRQRCADETRREEENEVEEGKDENMMKEDKEMEGKKGDGLGEKRSDGENDVHEGKRRKEKEEKRKEKEDKRKEKELKNKERKEMRSKRSHTAPSPSLESKPLPKHTQLSLKASPSNVNAPEERKKDKKKNKKKAESESHLPTTPPPFAGDRRSFTHRELPKRPSEDVDEGVKPTETIPGDNDDDNDIDDDNYEIVRREGPPPRDPQRLKVPPVNPSNNRGSDNYESDSNLYDSVDDQKEMKLKTTFAPVDIEADTYDMVQDKLPPPKPEPSSTTPTPELYESVSGEYEEPNIRKPRSSSDFLPNYSSPRAEAERKSFSLGRERMPEAPTPPPIENMKRVAELHQPAVNEIDPYTVTFKKGDLIIQETNLLPHTKPPKNSIGNPLTSDDVSMLYTKVDKEKQKRDRQEAEMRGGEEEMGGGEEEMGGGEEEMGGGEEEMRGGEEEMEGGEAEIGGGEEVMGGGEEEMEGGEEEMEGGGEAEVVGQANGEVTVAVSVVSADEHQYETVQRKEGAFYETEDFEYYEEVDTSKGL